MRLESSDCARVCRSSRVRAVMISVGIVCAGVNLRIGCFLDDVVDVEEEKSC